jgi:hypothetical protein
LVKLIILQKKSPPYCYGRPKTKLFKEKPYFVSGVVDVLADFVDPQHEPEEDDLSEQDDAQEDSHDFAHDPEALASDFTSLVSAVFTSAAFLLSSFLGSLSKFTISVCVEAAIRCCTPRAPKATKPIIARDKTSFFILLNVLD